MKFEEFRGNKGFDCFIIRNEVKFMRLLMDLKWGLCKMYVERCKVGCFVRCQMLEVRS